jgi:NADPH-dependent ferric siderophore reductase
MAMDSFGELKNRYRHPQHRRMLTLTVLDRERVSPHFVRVTLGGEDFVHLEQYGYDQWGRLFFAGPGQIEFAVHEEAADKPVAPGTAWALAAELGDQAAFLDEGCGHLPNPATAWQLLAADESALPAALATPRPRTSSHEPRQNRVGLRPGE